MADKAFVGFDASSFLHSLQQGQYATLELSEEANELVSAFREEVASFFEVLTPPNKKS